MKSFFQFCLARTLITALILFCGLSVAQDEGIDSIGTLKDGVRHVNAVQAAQIIQSDPTVQVLDVRTGVEHKLGHLKDSLNVNYYSFSFEKQLDKLDREVTWLVHCRTGVRSGKTVPIMKALGFKSIIHLDGGIVAWEKANQSVIK